MASLSIGSKQHQNHVHNNNVVDSFIECRRRIIRRRTSSKQTSTERRVLYNTMMISLLCLMTQPSNLVYAFGPIVTTSRRATCFHRIPKHDVLTTEQQQQQQQRRRRRRVFNMSPTLLYISSTNVDSTTTTTTTAPPKSRKKSRGRKKKNNDDDYDDDAPKYEQVQPLTAADQQTREKAIRTLERLHLAGDLSVDVDGNQNNIAMLNMLASSSSSSSKNNYDDDLEYFQDKVASSIEKEPKKRTRPRGRPKSVAGAMNFSSMMKRNARQAVAAAKAAASQKDGGEGEDEGGENVSPFVMEVASDPKLSGGSVTVEDVKPKKRVRGRPRKNPIPEDVESKAKKDVVPDVQTKVNGGRRRRVVKDLPKSRSSSRRNKDDLSVEEDGSKDKRKRKNNANLQKYFRTELLSREEEYELGMKIQLMIACETVHEGLYMDLLRIPTLDEWAEACGYIEEDSTEHPSSNGNDNDSNSPDSAADTYINLSTFDDQQIRPLKSEINRVQPAPNMFVGNGLAMKTGVGRGNGRVKKPPPSRLDDFFVDTSTKFPTRMEDDQDDEIPASQEEPTNRGSTRDFVRMMLEGREAKQRMVQCNMRLVVSIAKRYRNVGVNVADLVQEGSIGLARAADKFDPKKGFKFSTYASWWIQQAVFRSIAYHSRTIRLPVHVHNLLNRIRRIRRDLQQEYGRVPTNEEVSAKLGMSCEKYEKMIRLTRRSISLELPKYQNNPKDIGQESETGIVDTIDASRVLEDENTPEHTVDRGLFKDDVRKMLKGLEEDERRVINARYGLEDGLTRTVSAVAVAMGKTKSWVRSQECRALRKLRRPWYEQKLYEHQNSLLDQ